MDHKRCLQVFRQLLGLHDIAVGPGVGSKEQAGSHTE
jgi:hypothetical protein